MPHNPGEWLVAGLDLFIVALYLVKLALVTRVYRASPAPRTLHPLVAAVALAIMSVVLFSASLLVRTQQQGPFEDAMGAVLGAMRATLLITGLWLLNYWWGVNRRRNG